jgi:predicted metalloprotease with PDZ domain
MREMWVRHPDIEHPYTIADLQQTLAEATGDKRFAETMFRRHIFGSQPLDYESLLEPVGLILRKAHPGACWLGASSLDYSDAGITLGTSTLRGSPLYNAGLDRGDRIVAWNGKRIADSGALTALLAAHNPGSHMTLDAVTRAGKQTVDLVFAEDPTLEIVTAETAGRGFSNSAKRMRRDWLSSKALHAVSKVKPL